MQRYQGNIGAALVLGGVELADGEPVEDARDEGDDGDDAVVPDEHGVLDEGWWRVSTSDGAQKGRDVRKNASDNAYAIADVKK